MDNERTVALNMSEELYAQVKDLAKKDMRAVSRECVYLISKAVASAQKASNLTINKFSKNRE